MKYLLAALSGAFLVGMIFLIIPNEEIDEPSLSSNVANCMNLYKTINDTFRVVEQEPKIVALLKRRGITFEELLLERCRTFDASGQIFSDEIPSWMK